MEEGATMKAEATGFGELTIDGRTYEHDVIIDGGEPRKRKKKPSKPYRERFGHTPLSHREDLPWGGRELLVGTGYQGRLPVMDEVYREAERRGIQVLAVTTPEACARLRDADPRDVHAVLHSTC
jgi:hypothetical protein